MQKFLILLACSVWSITSQAEDEEPAPSSIGAVESSQHKTPDDSIDAAHMQELLNASHSGFYGLGFLGLGHHKSKVADQTYKAYSTQYGMIAGHGCTSENKRYLGAEVVYTRDLFDKRKGSTRFRRSNAYELVGRYGKIIQANFLTYMRLGIGYQDYQYFAATKKTNFYGVLLTPGVGVQAFVKTNVFIRAETNYQFTTSVKSKGIKINHKPHGPSMWGGVGIIF